MAPKSVVKLEKEVISEFITLYKKRPCLWNIRSPHYMCRPTRLAALHELLKILKKLNPDATIVSVRAKIDILRNNYKREKKKVINSINRGCSHDKVHIPCLWYYDLFDFLPDNAEVRLQLRKENEDLSITDCGSDNEKEEPIHEIPVKKTIKGKNKIKKDRKSFTRQNTSTPEKLKYHSDMDEVELYGKMLSIELNRLEEPNRSIAQKLMSDVLFYAKMGKLTDDSTIHIPLDSSRYECIEFVDDDDDDDDATKASESD